MLDYSFLRRILRSRHKYERSLYPRRQSYCFSVLTFARSFYRQTQWRGERDFLLESSTTIFIYIFNWSVSFCQASAIIANCRQTAITLWLRNISAQAVNEVNLGYSSDHRRRWSIWFTSIKASAQSVVVLKCWTTNPYEGMLKRVRYNLQVIIMYGKIGLTLERFYTNSLVV